MRACGCGVDGRIAQDPARPRCIQGHASQDRPQRRARHCPADATGLVSSCALQVAAVAGRALLTVRKLLQTKNHDVEMSLRGFGLKVGPTTPRTFPGRIRQLTGGHTTLSTVVEALLAARGALFEQW